MERKIRKWLCDLFDWGALWERWEKGSTSPGNLRNLTFFVNCFANKIVFPSLDILRWLLNTKRDSWIEGCSLSLAPYSSAGVQNSKSWRFVEFCSNWYCGHRCRSRVENIFHVIDLLSFFSSFYVFSFHGSTFSWYLCRSHTRCI